LAKLVHLISIQTFAPPRHGDSELGEELPTGVATDSRRIKNRPILELPEMLLLSVFCPISLSGEQSIILEKNGRLHGN
jgi:hypothetical protein